MAEPQRNAARRLNTILAVCLEPDRTSLPKRLRVDNRIRDALQFAVEIPPLLAKTAISCAADPFLFDLPNLGEAAAHAALLQILRLAEIESPHWADCRSINPTVDFAYALKSRWRGLAVEAARHLIPSVVNFRALGLPIPSHETRTRIALMALACDDHAAPHERAWALRTSELAMWKSASLLTSMMLVPDTVVSLAFDPDELTMIRERARSEEVTIIEPRDQGNTPLGASESEINFASFFE